jgi:protein TonB
MSTPWPTRAASRPDRFGRALLVGAALEGLLIASLLWAGSNTPFKPASPAQHIMAVHMLQPTPARPNPCPAHFKPVIRHPLPKPISRPVPVPIPTAVPAPAPRLLFATHPAADTPFFALPPALSIRPPQNPSATRAAQGAALDLYAALVRSRVQANLEVPEAIRLMRLSGRTEVAFELQPSGTLLWARIERSSGIGAIDRAALHTVKTTEYPPFTKDMPKLSTTFAIEVRISGRRAS